MKSDSYNCAIPNVNDIATTLYTTAQTTWLIFFFFPRLSSVYPIPAVFEPERANETESKSLIAIRTEHLEYSEAEASLATAVIIVVPCIICLAVLVIFVTFFWYWRSSKRNLKMPIMLPEDGGSLHYVNNWLCKQHQVPEVTLKSSGPESWPLRSSNVSTCPTDKISVMSLDALSDPIYRQKLTLFQSSESHLYQKPPLDDSHTEVSGIPQALSGDKTSWRSGTVMAA